MRARRLVLALAALGLLLPGPQGLTAQEIVDPTRKADPRGFTAGLALNGMAISYEGESDTFSGPGLTLRLGYAPNPSLSLFAQINGGSVGLDDASDDYTLGHFDLGVRGQLWAPSRRVVPFAEVMYGSRVVETDELGATLRMSGSGLGGSLGAMIFLQPGLSLDLGVTVNGGSFSTIEFQGLSDDVDEPASSARVSIGLSWFSR